MDEWWKHELPVLKLEYEATFRENTPERRAFAKAPKAGGESAATLSGWTAPTMAQATTPGDSRMPEQRW